MAVDKFLNIMRMQASLSNNGNARTALGKIIAYDENNYFGIVELYPADPSDENSYAMTTGWLPIFSPWVGEEFGFFAPPGIDDIVEVHFQEGSMQNGYIGLRCWNMEAKPLSVPSGEFWLVHKTGSYIKMKNTGEIEINSSLIINASAPTITINGAVTIGNIEEAVSGFLNGMALAIYNSHTHAIISPGVTEIPTQQFTPDTLSTNVQGN